MKRNYLFVIALLFLQAFIAVSGVMEFAPVLAANPRVLAVASTITLTPESNPAATEAATQAAPPPMPPAIATLQANVAASKPASPKQQSDISKIERVLIISFDGMRPDAIAAAPMPNLLKLMESSAYTLSGRTIQYPTTLPSHTSMLSGMCMEKHGLRYNSKALYRGNARGTDIFDLIHDAGMKSVMIVAKDKLEQIPDPGTVDVVEIYGYEDPIAKAAVKDMAAGFDLMFLHFPSADKVGHKQGWMSPFQMRALRDADIALGEVLTALDENGLRDSTLVIVTADHGGHDRTHDGTRIEDYLIPWIASGPGIVPGEIKDAIKTMDTAATTAFVLGLPIPPEWDGLPVYEAFGIIPQDIHYRTTSCE